MSQKNWNPPRRNGGERQILAVVPGPEHLASVMVEMRVIGEGRHEERDATEEVPDDAEGQELLFRQMNDLVDEHRGPIIGRALHGEGSSREGQLEPERLQT